jgi:hypothetical protein
MLWSRNKLPRFWEPCSLCGKDGGSLDRVTECLENPGLTFDDDDMIKDYFYNLLKVKRSLFCQKETNATSRIVPQKVITYMSKSEVNGWWAYLKKCDDICERGFGNCPGRMWKRGLSVWNVCLRDFRLITLDNNSPIELGTKRKRE